MVPQTVVPTAAVGWD